MNLRKRQIRAARKAKAQRLQRWQGVPTPSSQFATQGVRPSAKRFGPPSRAVLAAARQAAPL
jgi:hypothetical protein